MTGVSTRKLQIFITLAPIGSVAGLAFGLPQLVALAAPFAVYVAVGVALARRPNLTIAASVPRRRVQEDEGVGAPVARWRDVEPLQVPVASTAELKRRLRRPVAA